MEKNTWQELQMLSHDSLYYIVWPVTLQATSWHVWLGLQVRSALSQQETRSPVELSVTAENTEHSWFANWHKNTICLINSWFSIKHFPFSFWKLNSINVLLQKPESEGCTNLMLISGQSFWFSEISHSNVHSVDTYPLSYFRNRASKCPTCSNMRRIPSCLQLPWLRLQILGETWSSSQQRDTGHSR